MIFDGHIVEVFTELLIERQYKLDGEMRYEFHSHQQ